MRKSTEKKKSKIHHILASPNKRNLEIRDAKKVVNELTEKICNRKLVDADSRVVLGSGNTNEYLISSTVRLIMERVMCFELAG